MSRRRTCRGKVRFRDRAEAVRIMHAIAVRSTRERVPVRAYECDRCAGSHITSWARVPS